ncbi:copper homeostasis protein CutC [Streptomyces sp. MUM 2J]|uniref:copper homeostasis protein CutC n=1 Tax=Streptomyces sp. MUM 2J TaxID=2791987 RepID=UPI001F046D9F|nr:copper homeostasis protein CutC [Streptomyces sp. MUM 2J]MCH0564847.1 copper homeostasis protein CutC [Streptomyces sp. MUM 2J]
MNTDIQFEVCVDSADGARAAQDAGAHRVELCCALFEGGLTPSAGLVQTTLRAAPRLEVNVLIRPRAGDFVYNELEASTMLSDIGQAAAAGVHGIVIGALTPDGDVDVRLCRAMMDAAPEQTVTFHRAFDMVHAPFQALETLISLGIDRVLTSGQESSALEGAPLLAQLVASAANRIQVMPGAGVTPTNAQRILQLTGARNLHFSARTTEDSPVRHRNPRPAMGGYLRHDEFVRHITSESGIRGVISATTTS